ncbi:MAG: hypothetical protein HC888_01695 [Candidatus Competibacteraceae bacterium]|nr:hypothetical protein [Candidatus Competibacteraceae bacterium]
MSKSIQLLAEIADQLDSLKLASTASKVDQISTNLTQIKTAQYVGSQGYWIRNSRCWQNCYRQKRVANKNMPAQQVWSECHKEYVKSINDDKSGWERYAGDVSTNIKIASSEQVKKIASKQAAIFNETLHKRLEEGWPVGNAVFAAIEDGAERYSDLEIDQAEAIIDLADSIRHKHQKVASRLDDAALEVIKEAQFWNNVKGVGNQFSNWFNGRTNPINFNEQNFITIIDQLENTLNGYKTQKAKIEQMLTSPLFSNVQVRDQMLKLLKNLNTQSLKQMRDLASSLDGDKQQPGLSANPQAEQNAKSLGDMTNQPPVDPARALGDMANQNQINGGLPGEQKGPVMNELNLPEGSSGGVTPRRPNPAKPQYPVIDPTNQRARAFSSAKPELMKIMKKLQK